jgi:tetratricopeptide (TPR) repeat protein
MNNYFRYPTVILGIGLVLILVQIHAAQSITKVESRKLAQRNYTSNFADMHISSSLVDQEEDFFLQGIEKEKNADIEGAIKDFDQAIRINPSYAKAYAKRGSIRDFMGDKLGSIQDYNDAIRLDPNLAEAYKYRGGNRYDSEDYKGAIEDFDQAIRINPNNANIYFNRGNTQYILGNFQEAIKDYSQAIRLDPIPSSPYAYPNAAEAYAMRGKARYRLGDTQEAIRDLKKAAALAKQLNNKALYRQAQFALSRLAQLNL